MKRGNWFKEVGKMAKPMQLLKSNVEFYCCVVHEIDAHSSTSNLTVSDESINYNHLYKTSR